MKSSSVTIQMKGLQQYFPVVLFVLQKIFFLKTNFGVFALNLYFIESNRLQVNSTELQLQLF